MPYFPRIRETYLKHVYRITYVVLKAHEVRLNELANGMEGENKKEI